MKNTSTIVLILTIVHLHLPAQVPDPSFGIPASFELFNGADRLGVTGCNFEDRHDRVYSTLHLSDGKIVLAGHTSGQGGTDFALVRLLPDGKYDFDAGPQGQIRIDLGYANDSCLVAALSADEQILMGGCVRLPEQSGYTALVAKVDINGQPDAAFGDAGHIVFDLPSDHEMVTKIIPLPDGKALIAGNAYYGAPPLYFPDSAAFFIARLLPNGQVDITFGENGFIFQRFNQTCNASILEDMVVDPEGRIIVTGGLYHPYPQIDGIAFCYLPDIPLCRYLPDGQLDPAFGVGGIVRLDHTSGWPNALYIDEDGKILVAGVNAHSNVTTYAFVSRLLPNGMPDISFADNGQFKRFIYSLSVAPGFRGMLKIGDAYYLSYGNKLIGDFWPAGLIRLTENGAFDDSFGMAQGFGGIGFSLNSWVHNMVNIEQISSTDPESIFLTGTYRLSGHENMMIAKIKLGTVVSVEAPFVQEMKVFPNPVQSGKLFLDCTGTAQTNSSTLQLFDLYGRVAFRQIITLIEGTNEVELPDIPNGVYVLEITGMNFRRFAKIIVQ